MAETVVTNRQLDIADGWIPAQETWTYASANSFTVAGVDVTAKYPKGTKLKFTNGSVKYKYVASTSFSTNTTVTTMDDDSYDLADAAISSPYYSYMDTPQGFPTRFIFTTTYTGFSSDPTGTLVYNCAGGMVSCYLRSGTGTSNAASFDFTIPTAPDWESTAIRVFYGAILDNGSLKTVAGVVGIGETTTAKVGIDFSTASGNAFGGFTTSGTKAIQVAFWYPL